MFDGSHCYESFPSNDTPKTYHIQTSCRPVEGKIHGHNLLRNCTISSCYKVNIQQMEIGSLIQKSGDFRTRQMITGFTIGQS